MKAAFLLLLSLLIGARPSAPPVVRITFSPLTKAAYLQAKKGCIETKPRVTFPVKKHDGSIVKQTLVGKRDFRDATVEEDNPDWEKYTYLGYDTHGAYHLILRNHVRMVELPSNPKKRPPHRGTGSAHFLPRL